MRVLRVRYQNNVFYAALLQPQSSEGAGADEMPPLEVQCLNNELGFEKPIPLQHVAVLPPVLPTKIVCVAVNYKKHAEEMGKVVPEEPVIFLKPPTAIIGSGQHILLPRQSKQVDYEGELGIVIGKSCRHITQDEVAPCIFGYTCANDVTARDLQRKDGLFGRGKGFDTFCPVGPWIETHVDDPDELNLRTYVNDELRQDSNTSDMAFSPHFIVSHVASVMTLHPGDLILTGTPSGVGPIHDGDEVRIEIANVGTLINTAISEVGEDELEGEPIQ